MGGKIDRILTVVEGRALNQGMMDDFSTVAKKSGFEIRIVKSFDAVKIAEDKLDETFSDLVLWRGPVGYTHDTEISRVLLWLNDHRKITINTNITGGRPNGSNKYFQHGLFMRDAYLKKHINPMYPAVSKENLEKLVNDGVLKYPFLLKPDFGTRGLGIKKIARQEDLDNFTDDFMEYSAEEYINSVHDWRVFVVGGVAVAVMKKIGNLGNPDDFEAKSGGYHRWCERNPEIIKEVSKLAVKACVASGLEYAGVDIIYDDFNRRFVVLETNVAGGWQNGVVEATGVSIPETILDWFKDRVELYETPIFDAVNNYIARRLPFLSSDEQELYKAIVSGDAKLAIPRDVCSIRLKTPGISLLKRLEAAYVLAMSDRISSDDIVRIEALILEVEERDISRYGNYIGGEMGLIGEAVLLSAYYLAIKKTILL